MTSDSASRVTRSRNGLRPLAVLLAGAAVALCAPGAAIAQETPRPAQPAAAADAAPATEPATGDTGAAAPAATQDPGQAAPGSQPADAKPAPGDAAARPPKERFEPTEKVRADFDVSFPVDI